MMTYGHPQLTSDASQWISPALRRISKWLRRIVTGYCITNLVLGALFPFLLVYPPRRGLTAAQESQLAGTLRAQGLQVEPIAFTTTDRVSIRGWMLWPPTKQASTARSTDAAIILIHGRYANRRQMIPYAHFLARAGFPALLYDSRGQGQSSDHPCTYGLTERLDVRSAIDFLRVTYGIERVGLLGRSLGAAIALEAAAEVQTVRAVVADSPFASLRSVADHYGSAWGLLPGWVTWPARVVAFRAAEKVAGFSVSDVSPEQAAARIHAPVFLIHGQADWRIPADHSRRIYRRLAGPRELWLVPQAGHSRGYRVAGLEYEQRVLGFFKRHL